MHVRAATSSDAGEIQRIYAHHVRHGVGTFEEEPPDRAEIEARMRQGHWVVAETDGRLLGYAYYGPYRSRSGYRLTVEDSVYVRPDAVGRGVGSRLLAALVEHAHAAGYRQSWWPRSAARTTWPRSRCTSGTGSSGSGCCPGWASSSAAPWTWCCSSASSRDSEQPLSRWWAA